MNKYVDYSDSVLYFPMLFLLIFWIVLFKIHLYRFIHISNKFVIFSVLILVQLV